MSCCQIHSMPIGKIKAVKLLNMITNDWATVLDTGGQTGIFILDFGKAF